MIKSSIQFNSARRHIKSIQKDIFETPPKIRKSLVGANKALRKNFTRYESFLMELLQNAEDENSTSIRFELRKDSLRIINNGNPFINRHVSGISRIGDSPKKTGNYIGYLGVGFKSVFIISEAPEIHSGRFHFKFDRNHKWKEIDSEVPYEILPIWVDDYPDDIDKRKTTFIFPIKWKSATRIKREFSRKVISSRIMLFLRNIQKIEFVNIPDGKNRIIQKEPSIKKRGYEISKIIEYENGEIFEKTEWVLFKKRCRVPAKVKKDETTIEWERHKLITREVSAAIRVHNSSLIKEDGGTIHVGLFSFLPIKEEVEGLNYILQGDFLTAAGRDTLARDNSWNKWIADELTKLIIGKCIPSFLKHEKWKMNFTDILYSNEGGHQLIDKRIKRKINRFLKENNVVVSKDNRKYKPNQILKIDNEILEFFSNKELAIMFPDRVILHPDCIPAKGLGCSHYRDNSVIKMAYYNREALNNILIHKSKRKDIGFFIKLYREILKYCNDGTFYYRTLKKYNYNVEHDRWMDGISDINLILTNRFQLTSPNKTFVNSKKLIIGHGLWKKLPIVHPKIASKSVFEEFKKAINIRWGRSVPHADSLKTLDRDLLRKMRHENLAKELTIAKWRKFSKKEKMQQIVMLKGVWEEDKVDLVEYDFLTFKTKNNNWMRPHNIIFSKEYQPEHRLEKLNESGSYDKRMNYLSPEYLELDKDDIIGWSEFFCQVGIDNIVNNDKSNIVERIAIITCMRYEREKKRRPTEIGQSEKLVGDIRSTGKSKKRIIEVKGTSMKPEEFSIDLKKNQSQNIFLRNTTHLYIVCDALSTPHLFVLTSDTIDDLSDHRISVGSSKWNNPDVWQDNWINKVKM